MRKGKFEQADGGTLFLDEVGDMSASAQAKVLRALQENKVTRVGSDKDIPVNVRVFVTTNKNPKEAIAKGEFREDLYHRLAVVPIHVPSSRSVETLTCLCSWSISCPDGFSRRQSGAEGCPKAMALLTEAAWTRNIRELRNVVERLLIFVRQARPLTRHW